MAEFFWPLDIIPNKQTWSIRDASAVFTSPMTGTTKTVTRPGTRVGCSITLTKLSTSQRHKMLALIAALRGRANRIWIPDISTPLRGSFPATELLTNTVFETATTGWSSSSSELVLSVDSGRMRLTRTGVLADRYVSAPITTVASTVVLFRAGVIQGRAAPSYALQVGTTGGGAELVAGAQKTAGGLQHVVAPTTGTLSFPAIRDYSSGRAADFFQIVDSPSAARCAWVQGASQTGSGLYISALPVSTDGLLLAGDIVAVYTDAWEIKRLTANLNSNASGTGFILFEPALRVSPANAAPVAIYRPMAKFMLAGESVGWETLPGFYSDFTLDFMEDIT